MHAVLSPLSLLLAALGGTSLGENTTKCYEPYGCFNIIYPWTDVNRPISYLPEPPEKVNAKFCLLTRRNRNKCQYLSPNDPNTFYWAYVNHHDYTFVICHGYLENEQKPWIKRLADELLENRDANVIVVDWGQGARPPYSQAVANTRLVGAITAQLLSNLRVVGVQGSRVHFIGHSLGAHIGGYTGFILQTQHDFKIGRITGLDPAAPYFSGTLPEVRLDPSDADFVDVIHSDASRLIKGSFGMTEPSGHVDFYPNGGQDQPGCDEGVSSYFNIGSSFVEGMRKMINCDHMRSYEYFTESVNGNCSFAAVECSSWEAYLNGSCFACSASSSQSAASPNQSLCAPLGFHADSYLRSDNHHSHDHHRENVKMFLVTGADFPHCKSQYRIRFQVSCSYRSIEHNGEVGVPRVTIHGERGVTTSIPLVKGKQYFAPGSKYQIVVPAEYVGNITALTLEWEYQTSLLNILSWRIITTPRIYIDWLSVELLGQQTSLKVCPTEDTPLISRIPMTLTSCQRETHVCARNGDEISYRR